MDEPILSLYFSSYQLISSSIEELYPSGKFTDRSSLLDHPCTKSVFYCLKSVLAKKLSEKNTTYNAFTEFNISLTSPLRTNLGHNTVFAGCLFSFVLNEHNKILKNSNKDFVLIHRKSAAECIIIVIINDTCFHQ